MAEEAVRKLKETGKDTVELAVMGVLKIYPAYIVRLFGRCCTSVRGVRKATRDMGIRKAWENIHTDSFPMLF